jgi:hypothetical protein
MSWRAILPDRTAAFDSKAFAVSAPSRIEPLGYLDRAQMHQPRDAQAISTEIRRLRSTGLEARDISIALRLDPAMVEQALHDAITDNSTRQEDCK